MIVETKKPKSISEYIDAAPMDTQEKLWEMVACIRKAAPKSEENLKWGMPAFSYKRILATFAVFKYHIGLYPTPSAVTHFEKKLTKFKTAKGSIQFPLDKPLPKSLIHQIIRFRVMESLEVDRKWKPR